MPTSELLPLDPATWFDSLRRLEMQVLAGAQGIESNLRLGFYLARLAPPPYALIANSEIDEKRFEVLLRNEGFDAAAVSLIGSELSYEVAHIPAESTASARVWVNDISARAELPSNCVACALLQAWVRLLLRFEPEDPDWLIYASQRSA